MCIFPPADGRYSYITKEIRLITGRIVVHTIPRAVRFRNRDISPRRKYSPVEGASPFRETFPTKQRYLGAVPARAFSQGAKGYAVADSDRRSGTSQRGYLSP